MWSGAELLHREHPVQLDPEQLRGLRPSQLLGVEFLCRKRRALLADQAGVGKTAQLIGASKAIGGRTLVVCPVTIGTLVWRDELQRWAPTSSIELTAGLDFDGRLRVLLGDADFVITGYETLMVRRTVKQSPDEFRDRTKQLQRALTRGFRTVVFDECHRAKSRDSKTFKAVEQICRAVPNVFLATGTPILNHSSELWALLHLLYPSVFRGYWRFAEAFCEIKWNGFGNDVLDIVDESDPRLRTLHELIDPVVLRRLKVDVLRELPPKTVQRVPVAMSSATRRAYDDMKRRMLAEIGDQLVFAPTALSQLTRLRQFVIDPSLALDDHDELPLYGDKAQAVLELLDSLQGTKVVIFSQWSTVIDRLKRRLDEEGYSSAVITGSTQTAGRIAAINSFTICCPQVDILLATIGAGGVGLNLQAASSAIFIDKLWTPALNEQAQDRLHRSGQTKNVTIYELYVPDTIDDLVEVRLDRKLRVIDLIMG